MAGSLSPTGPQLVSLTGGGARIVMWGYFTATLVLALWTVSDWTHPALAIAALLVYAAVSLLITFDTGQRLSLPSAIAGALVGPLSVVLVAWQLVPGGYTAWYVGGATAMFIIVTLRGRILISWIGCTLFVIALLAWGITTQAGLGDAGITAARQTTILLIGTLTAVSLRRTSARIRSLEADASLRSAAEAAALAAADERSRRLADLRRTVVPLLERIADGGTLTDADRRDFAAAEAELRDGLRARGLRQNRLVDAARSARARGVDVVLLDDSDPARLALADLERFADVAVSALDGAVDGRVTARLLPPGRASIGTIVADGSNYARHEVQRG